MLETLKNALLAGLGAVSLTQEKMHAVVEDLIKRGQLTREQGKHLVDELLRRGQEEGKIISEKVAGEMANVMEKTPLATRRELQRLEERIRALEVRLGTSLPSTGEATPPVYLEGPPDS
ncbi:MAG TPA: hypothetical protein VMT52_18375 [Planctomycetota bacterium]|nr:hypothetical protein [Planctomycetota bacterium]